MRTEQEMFNLIKAAALKDERIRAVIMTGSRANPMVQKDIFQDYDIIYYVTDVTPFYNNMDWIAENFGKPSVMQLPELMKHPSLLPDGDGHFTYLMIFEDGNRIDLNIIGKPYSDDGEPAIVLLDKDCLFTNLPKPSDTIWHVTMPNETIYHDCCNEFWWCLNNVGKGIARDELPYAMQMFHQYVQDMLHQMLDWYIGVNTNFSVSAGKSGKYYKRYLSKELYEQYCKTYSDSRYDNFWTSVLTACDLFQKAATFVAAHLSYSYNSQEEEGLLRYLNFCRESR